MKYRKYSRREFLALSATFFASGLLQACGSKLPKLISPIQPVEKTTTEPGNRGILNPKGGDVWSWVKDIHGKLPGLGDCQEITVAVNGRKFAIQNQGDDFTARTILQPGYNQVEAICRQADGQEVVIDMVEYNLRLRRVPKAVIRISFQQDGVVLDGLGSTQAKANGAPITTYTWSVSPDNPGELRLIGEGGETDEVFAGEVVSPSIALLPPLVDGEYYLNLQVVDQDGAKDTAATYFVVTGGKPHIPNYDVENPAWVEKAVVYGVIPRNFGSPDAFQAIIERLDYLADLGVNALWLAPINLSPAADYGYAVVDYFKLNPRFGSEDDFQRLVQEAHGRGIRVLMDFVPNHSSAEHPYFLDTLENGQESSYWDFYDRDGSGQATHYFSWDHLPNLNYDNPEVERWMMEAFSYWVREFDVDGFRVDVAWGIKERKPDFWLKWRRELKRIKPDLLLLAEASARDPYYFENGFDAAYDWTSELGQWAWELVWDSYKHRLLAYNLDVALTNRPNGYPPDALVFRFLNNNDTGDRFITTHGERLTRVATALLLTLPGIPCIYTGDEVGEWFRPYYDPQPLTWKDDRYPGLRQYHQKLIALRKEIPSLHSRQWTRLAIEPVPQEVYGYIRYTGDFEQPVVVLLNFFEEPADMVFELPEPFQAMLQDGSLRDILNEDGVPMDGNNSIRVQVPGFSARILTKGVA